MAEGGTTFRCPCAPCQEYYDFESVLLRRQERERTELLNQYNARCHRNLDGGLPANWFAFPTPQWSSVPALRSEAPSTEPDRKKRVSFYRQADPLLSSQPGVGEGDSAAPVTEQSNVYTMPPSALADMFAWDDSLQMLERLNDGLVDHPLETTGTTVILARRDN